MIFKIEKCCKYLLINISCLMGKGIKYLPQTHFFIPISLQPEWCKPLIFQTKLSFELIQFIV